MKRGSLDQKDLQILQILQENGRASYSEIAKRIGMSEAAVYARVQKLLRLKVVKRIQAIIDSEKLGYGVTAFIMINAQPPKYEKVLESLSSMPEVLEVHDVTGEHYCLIKVRARSNEELAGILDEIGRLDGVISTETKIVLRTIKERYDLPIVSSGSARKASRRGRGGS